MKTLLVYGYVILVVSAILSRVSGADDYDNVVGQVSRVIDGDTLVMESGERIRLGGLDAPELSQPGGEEAKAHLEGMIEDCPDIRIDRRGDDHYGRTVAVLHGDCGGGLEVAINASMVVDGWAWAVGGKFAPDQARAMRLERGIWMGSPVDPAQWRGRQ